MSDEQIRQYAQEKGFHPVTLQRWLSWAAPDRQGLLDLALATRASENHVRDLIEWLEEISLRDHVAITDILAKDPIARIATDPRLGRVDKLRQIKQQMRRLRFPRLSAIEDSIHSRIRELKLKAPVRLSVPAGLEGAKLHVEFDASTQEEFLSAVRELAEARHHPSMDRIFALLRGETLLSENGFGPQTRVEDG
jgi:hypothetical protein